MKLKTMAVIAVPTMLLAGGGVVVSQAFAVAAPAPGLHEVQMRHDLDQSRHDHSTSHRAPTSVSPTHIPQPVTRQSGQAATHQTPAASRGHEPAHRGHRTDGLNRSHGTGERSAASERHGDDC